MLQRRVSGRARRFFCSCAGYGDGAAKSSHSDVCERLDRLEERGAAADFSTYMDLLRACASSRDLPQGKRLHAQINSAGAGGDTILGNLLVRMYGKCEALDDAIAAFESIEHPNVFSWSILVTAYAENGHLREALDLLGSMDLHGVKASHVTFINLLGACTLAMDLAGGERLHARIEASGFDLSGNLGTALVSMYARCGGLDRARDLFDRMRKRDIIAWNAMIAAYSLHGRGDLALELYYRIEPAGLAPDRSTFLSTLVTCESIDSVKKLHGDLAARGLEREALIGNTLVSMYGRCGSLDEAMAVFVGMPYRNGVTWGILIGAHAQHGKAKEALRLLKLMDCEGVRAMENTFLTALSACSSAEFLGDGRRIHERIAASGVIDESSTRLSNALVTMYGKCGSLIDAESVFNSLPCRTIVSWTSLIAAYAQHGFPRRALQIFKQMDAEGTKPDEIAFLSVLEAVSNAPELIEEGRRIHEEYQSNRIHESQSVETALIDMYGNCGSIESAWRVFDQMGDERRDDVIPWTSMITACAHQGHSDQALLLLSRMELQGIHPNQLTLVSALDACEDLREGRKIHATIAAKGLSSSVIPGTALVNMYDRCGALASARAAFEEIRGKNSISWNAIIGAYAHQGDLRESMGLLQRMDQEGVAPNVISFTCVLFACAHAGSIREARHQFHLMIGDYSIEPLEDNYGCLVDLLGRAGRLDKVEELIQTMPMWPSPAQWMSLLGACHIHARTMATPRRTS
ncbi:pentatricopeptide repeat-containing protein At3g03580 [Selaginella moellendorffii]|uniref:pentatricopeptide repeat-containing protein At3g03580 n=1 Tax=Selaginella moellendorffii TaxID=88036 RepID=UPI000D1C7D10|nr:pentatricopeptide repeat-containing protein At3g03580 [Selaginella moellendorffii]|eukprot:XP_024522785.1 pentatricopeptide repeat-containing protein At3g03580 [Selaginella moellendorffii]